MIPLLLAGFAVAGVPVPEDGPRIMPRPEPLEERPFDMPEVQKNTLSNGIEVRVVSNHEVPIWYVRVLFDVGSFADPEGKEGLAASTLAMVDKGAGDRSAEAIARELKRLGASLGANADVDGSTVSAWGIKRNLGPTLDIMADVVKAPTFPAADWEIVRQSRKSRLANARKDPADAAWRVFPSLLWTGPYRGNLETDATYDAITAEDLAAFHEAHLTPGNAIILAGGDVTAEEIAPYLEARFGSWAVDGADPRPAPQPTEIDAPVLYLLDSPGASQTTITIGTFVGAARSTDDWFDMDVAMTAFGGAFTSRVNMNLREDKHYTYGARCGLSDRQGPTMLWCSTSVQADATGPSLTELKKEWEAVLGDRPITEEELAYFQSYRINGFPGRFETPTALLDEHESIWRYGLDEGWVDSQLPGIRAVTTDKANAAFREQIRMDRFRWLVAGDASEIRKEVEAFGVPIIEVDADGNIIE